MDRRRNVNDRVPQPARVGIASAFLALVAVACVPSTPAPASSPAPWTPIRLGPTSTAPLVVSQPSPFTPSPSLVPLKPISDADWAIGPVDAAATFVVYCDFQDAACQKFDAVIRQLITLHPDAVRLVYRPFPLVPVHDKASLADQAAWAAAAQGAFWPMHDLLYTRYAEWASLSPESFKDWLYSTLPSIRLDAVRFRADIEGRRYEANVAASYNQGVASGIPGVPYVFLNGDLYTFGPSLLNMEGQVRLILLRQRQFSTYPAMRINLAAQYVAHISLNIGQVDIQLWADKAPIAVNSFVFLARQSWYDGSPVFRVTPGSLVEMGDPTGTGIGGPGYTFDLEIHDASTFDRSGLVAMSSSGPGTNGSRFFITLSPQRSLDGSRTIIGRVTRGLDLLNSLPARDPLTDLLKPAPAVMETVSIEGP